MAGASSADCCVAAEMLKLPPLQLRFATRPANMERLSTRARLAKHGGVGRGQGGARLRCVVRTDVRGRCRLGARSPLRSQPEAVRRASAQGKRQSRWPTPSAITSMRVDCWSRLAADAEAGNRPRARMLLGAPHRVTARTLASRHEAPHTAARTGARAASLRAAPAPSGARTAPLK